MQVIRQRYWINPPSRDTGWRAIESYCIKELGNNTGQQAFVTLEEYYLDDQTATGQTKPNTVEEPEYVAPINNEDVCPIPRDTKWRPIDPYCVQEGGENTGYQAYLNLEEYYIDTLQATGITKPNVSSDSNYIAPIYKEVSCPLPEPEKETIWFGTDQYCKQDENGNTGFLAYATLVEYYKDSFKTTGSTKPNALGDPDYIEDRYSEHACPIPEPAPNLDWRAIDPYCVKQNGENTGMRAWTNLEEYNVDTNQATGKLKPNTAGDPDYVAPVSNETACPIPLPPEPVYDWRGINMQCIKEDDDNTGYQNYTTLEEYDVDTGIATGNTKPNVSFDPDFIVKVYNETACPLPQQPEYRWEGYQESCEVESVTTEICEDYKADIVFILDITGSMDDSLASLKNSLSSIVNSIGNQFPKGYRLSLVTVTDGNTPYQIRVPLGSNNQNTLQTVLNSLSAGGGDRIPEPTDQALEAILNGDAGVFGEDDTIKSIFIITDAIPKINQSETSTTLYTPFIQELSNDALSQGIKIFPIGVGHAADPNWFDYPRIQQAHDIYADTTGGLKYNILNGVVDDSIIDVIENESCEETTYFKNTGFKAFARLRKLNIDTGAYVTNKINDINDPDYIAPVYDPNFCERTRIYLYADRTIINTNYNATGFIINVESNNAWSVVLRSTSLSFIDPDEANGQFNGQFSFSLSENTRTSARTLRIELISDVANIIVVIEIEQSAKISLIPKKLAKSFSHEDACIRGASIYTSTKYLDNSDFITATKLYDDVNGLSLSRSAYYSDGNVSRYWTGTQFYNAFGLCRTQIR